MSTSLKVTLVKSLIGTNYSHRATAHGLGLRKLNKFRILPNSPEVKGMINKINYLLKVEEV